MRRSSGSRCSSTPSCPAGATGSVGDWIQLQDGQQGQVKAIRRRHTPSSRRATGTRDGTVEGRRRAADDPIAVKTVAAIEAPGYFGEMGLLMQGLDRHAHRAHLAGAEGRILTRIQQFFGLGQTSGTPSRTDPP